MDWLSFIASIVHSVAWPVAIIVAVFVLKERIAGLLTALTARFGNLTKLSGMGWTAEFDAKAAELIEEAEKLPGPEPGFEFGGELVHSDDIKIIRVETGRLEQVADIDPRAAVLAAFVDVESALKDVSNRLSIRPDRGGASGYASALRATGRLSPDALELIRDLNELRNRVSHDPTAVVTLAAAKSYIAASKRVIEFLYQIDPDIPTP